MTTQLSSATPLKTVKLNPLEFKRIHNGHPWIYAKSIAHVDEGVNAGDQVRVVSSRGEIMGTGFFHPDSKIRVRLIRRSDHPIDAEWIHHCIRKALAYRRMCYPGRSVYRLINSESDGLSGLIVDRYEDALLFQISSLGMERLKPLIIDALNGILQPAILIERNDAANRHFEGLDEIRMVHKSNREENSLAAFRIPIEGLVFETDLIHGNKTGLYLDQLDNHLIFRSIVEAHPGARVLDCFSYIGGFALNAAFCGATGRVTGLDQSNEAVMIANRNAELNGLAERCSFERTNVFDWFRERASPDAVSPENLFDVIVLDPPSFTKNRHTVEGAIRGYKELHVRALRLLKPGGHLLTFSCSHHIPSDLLRSIVWEASLDTGRSLIESHLLQQAKDHPVVPSIPESFYLKGFAYFIND